MATIRFIREDLEVQCNPGENLRELVMKENLQLYGLKGILGNCGGAGQCSTCFISVEGGNKNSLSPLTSVEEEKLKNRPCLLYTSPSPRDPSISRMPSSA